MQVVFEPSRRYVDTICERGRVESLMMMCAAAPLGNEGVQQYPRESLMVALMPPRPIPAGSGEIDTLKGGIPPVHVTLTERHGLPGCTSFSTSLFERPSALGEGEHVVGRMNRRRSER